MGEVFDLESREVQLFDAKDLSAAARTVIEAMRRVTLMIAEVLLRQHLVRIRQDDYNSDELNANLPVLTNSLTKHFEGVQKQFPRHIDNVIAAIDSDNDKKLDANELRTQFVPRVAQYAHTLKVDNLTGASGATGQKSTASGSAPSSTGPTPATTPSPAPGATSKPDATATTGAAAAATTAAAAPAANGVGLTA